MNGLHLSAEFHGCTGEPTWLTDAQRLHAGCVQVVRAAGLQAVGAVFHPFPASATGQPGGVTGVVLLAESHLALHTWPELAAVTLDVYVCNRSGDHSAQARQVMAALERLFQPARVEQRAVMRGAIAAGSGPG
ncbi:adenosylmethionine decarboxylase [Sphaerotilus sp.]|uniref:adenosylmethionine decarboxylase n=1 Tax=Sphaerotilus sp. TaxID=2093942 RepID=UPI002ACEF2C3|nr:adenosylmethionine decarboxylase [Sphaerotilus sp.]MDZ7854873.1 adenosylmethionine decarboxylase [Sphaerotilus sp.]